MVYSKQCPWVARSIAELNEGAKETNLEFKITEVKTADVAQRGASIYSVFNVIHNGKLLADHYISTTRFLNIINKKIKAPD